MREIMLAIEADLDRIGTTSVVAFLVSSRFALAAAVLPLFPSVRQHLGIQRCGKPALPSALPCSPAFLRK